MAFEVVLLFIAIFTALGYLAGSRDRK